MNISVEFDEWKPVFSVCRETYELFDNNEWVNLMKRKGVDFSKPIDYRGYSVYQPTGKTLSLNLDLI